MRCFVISLSEAKFRREQVQKALADSMLDWNFFDAINGKQLEEAEKKKNYNKGRSLKYNRRELSPGEIGCALSHYSIYRRIISENIPYCAILEDDVVVSANIRSLLEKIEKFLQSRRDPMIVLLTGVLSYKRRADAVLYDNVTKLHQVGIASCAHGYVITNAAAKELENYIFPISFPADDWANFARNTKIKILCLERYPVDWAKHGWCSTIGNEFRNENQGILTRLRTSLKFRSKKLFSFLFCGMTPRGNKPDRRMP
jgi:glycosyl transferase family 25